MFSLLQGPILKENNLINDLKNVFSTSNSPDGKRQVIAGLFDRPGKLTVDIHTKGNIKINGSD